MSDEPNWPYDVLGLSDPEPGRKDIRRAYAKKLKQIDQETDAEGFEALRTAYQVALSIADNPQAPLDVPEPDTADTSVPDDWVQNIDQTQNAPPDAPDLHLSVEGQMLVDRIGQRQENEPDALRLTRVISDPLMSDPIVAQAVEQEIYYHLLDKIDQETSIYPSFDLTTKQNGVVGETDEFQIQKLMDALDDRFGWLSDQIGMQRKFVAYDTFLDAALNLGTTAQVPQETTSGGRNWATILWIIVIGVWITSHLFKAFDTPANVPNVQIRDTTASQDAAFLNVAGSRLDPSQQTMEFLQKLAAEQGFVEKTTSRVKLLVARNWAVLSDKHSIASRGNADYDNLEEIKYITGVLLATRYQMLYNLGYRETKDFSLSWDPARNIGRWRITKAGAKSDSLWQPGGAYMVAEYQDSDPDVFRAIYPEKFFRAMRRATGDDPRALEGALGLNAYTLDKYPYLRFFYYPDITIPGNVAASVDIDHHHLNHAGLGSNRWPIRAAPILKESCEVLTLSSGRVSTAHRC